MHSVQHDAFLLYSLNTPDIVAALGRAGFKPLGRHRLTRQYSALGPRGVIFQVTGEGIIRAVGIRKYRL